MGVAAGSEQWDSCTMKRSLGERGTDSDKETEEEVEKL